MRENVKIELAKSFNEQTEKYLVEQTERMAQFEKEKRDLQAKLERDIEAQKLKYEQEVRSKEDIVNDKVRLLGENSELKEKLEKKHSEILQLRDVIMNGEKDAKIELQSRMKQYDLEHQEVIREMNARFGDLTEAKRGVENENRDLLHKIDTLNFEIERLKHEIRESKEAYKGLD